MVPKEAWEERARRHKKVGAWNCFGEERGEEKDMRMRLSVVLWEVGEGLLLALEFSSNELLLRMEKRLVRKEPEGNGQGLREHLCGKKMEMVRG